MLKRETFAKNSENMLAIIHLKVYENNVLNVV